MEFTQKQNIQTISVLLFLAVITQAIYTALYVAANDLPRTWLWGIEGLLFVLMAAVAGSALAQTKDFTLVFSAIFASAILNIVQVGIGLTQFGPFYEAAGAVEGLKPAAGSVVALSFFIYNAAKILLGIAAVAVGMGISEASKGLGRLTVFVGGIAIITNTIVMMFGRIEAVPSGATGVVATLLLAVCLLKLKSD
ncbi:MAG: thiamine biosynthesis protein ThiC [Pseudomonadota bacterium]